MITRRTYLSFVGGLSFFWVFLRRSYFGLLLSSNTEMVLSSLVYYLTFIGLVLCLSVIAVFQCALIERIITKKPTLVLGTTFCASLGGLMMVASTLIPALSVPMTFLGVIFFSVGFLALIFCWGLTALQGEQRPMMICAILSFIASYLVSFALMLPSPIPHILAIVSPLISGALWFYCQKGFCVRDIELQQAQSPKDLRKLPIGSIVIIIAFLLVGGAMRGMLYSGDINYIPAGDAALPHMISIVFACMMLILVVITRHHEKLYSSIWTVLATLFFAGLFITAAFNSEWGDIGNGVLIAGRTCLGFFLWVILINNTRLQRLSPVMVLSIFFVFTEMISALLSYALVPGIVHMLGISFDEYIAVFGIGMALMLIIASFLFLNNRAFHDSPVRAEMTGTDEDSWTLICEDIASECDLTKRETEVMILISKGHSAKKIAELLFVSHGTIQAHSKVVYRKLDIHSRQDLIDLVNKRVRRRLINL